MNSLQTNLERDNNTDGFVQFALKNIQGEAGRGIELLGLGAKNNLAQLLERLYTDPLSFTINGIKRDHEQLRNMLELYYWGYFKSKSVLINSLYSSRTPSGINYFVVLKEDNSENREIFFELLDHYETLQINNIVPINISFLPLEAINRVDSLNRLDLA